MASGMDWAITALANFCGLTPEACKKQLADSAQIILGIDQRLARIEAQNNVIMSRLGIAQIDQPLKGEHDGQQEQITEHVATGIGAGQGNGHAP